MSKQVELLLPKCVGVFDAPDTVTSQHVFDALAADGFLAWLKERIRRRKPATVTIDSWEWVLKVNIDGVPDRRSGGEAEDG